jgi:hypothetical protein
MTGVRDLTFILLSLYGMKKNNRLGEIESQTQSAITGLRELQI